MPPPYFPLRWESTGEQWWYASPVDWAAANGHYDLVRELLRLDGNNLIKLTSLRRIRRLETVWDDEEQFDDVAKCRSMVARKLLSECETKREREKNSLIRAGYGGWLLYTAASAGDLGFVQELLEKDPLLVFGEGEYGVTDILYAAARSSNRGVFRLVYDFAASPRFDGKGGVEESIGEIPSAYKWEMLNRAVHAAARGGNLEVLKELVGDHSSDVLAFRDMQGSTILHAAAGRGQTEVVKDLIASFDIINATDNHGNTALHVAAHRGQLPVVEALILASPSSVYLKNNAGETFLHKVMSGFQTPSFHRLDKQIELMKQLVRGKLFNTERIINGKNNEGRTALHVAIIGNVHSDLVEQLMSVRSIDVNIRDSNGMTPLDLIKQQPRSAASDVLTRQLISAGGIFSCQDYTARRTIASHLRMRSIGSPGTSFRISDAEIFLHTGIENPLDSGGPTTSIEVTQTQLESTVENQRSSNSTYKKPASVNYAAQRLKRLFRWPRMKERKNGRLKKMEEKSSVPNLDETPISLRQRFSKPSSLPNNKRTLSVRSNVPSPNAKKKFASGIVQGVMQAMPHLAVPRRSRSSSFSKSSVSSSSSSVEKQKSVYIESSDAAGPSCLNQISDEGTPDLIRKQKSVNRSLVNQYLCFGGPSLSEKNPAGQQEPDQIYKGSVLSVV